MFNLNLGRGVLVCFALSVQASVSFDSKVPGKILDVHTERDFKKSSDFEWGTALGVMTYHRDKMNEYLCKSYIASEIVEGYRNLSGDAIDRRSGRPILQRHPRLARESLLADPGSKKYKDWLSRSSTLEDIYHQFEHSEEDALGHATELDHDGGHEGDVTGYALLDSKHVYSKPIEHETEPHYIYHHHEEEKEEEKGLKLKELFHFALTSIAFLAFATFCIEVIMSLMEVQQPTNSEYVLLPTTTGGTGPGSKVHENEVPENVRRTRSILLDPVSMETLNIMSSKVLTSIETLAMLHEDDGECFQRSLCQNTKFSRTLSGPQKIWLPLWSFGMSWIGSKMSRKNGSSDNSNALKYIKAAVMGLGNKECHVLHPKCDDWSRRRKKARR